MVGNIANYKEVLLIMTLLTVELVKQILAVRMRYKEIRRLSYRNERTEEGREVIKFMLRAEMRRLILLALPAIGIDLLRIIIFMPIKSLIIHRRYMSADDIGDDIIGDADDISDIISDAMEVGDTIGDALEDAGSITLDILHKIGFTFLDHWDTCDRRYI